MPTRNHAIAWVVAALCIVAVACSGNGNRTVQGTGGSAPGGTTATTAATGGNATGANGGNGGGISTSTGGTATGGVSAGVGGTGTGGGRTSAGGSGTGGSTASTGGATTGSGGTGTGSPGVGGTGTGGRSAGTGGNATGGARTGTGGTGTGGTGTSTGGSNCDATPGPIPTGLTAIPANGTVGLEWTPVAGATSYNVYWSTSSGVTPSTGQAIAGAARGYIQRGLSNGTTYYYVVTAVTAGGESSPSAQVSATPTGEWVLEQLGTGDFASVTGACPVAAVPLGSRIHVLLFPEGYTATALPTFHSDTTHATRNNDVDRWIDQVFAVEPYKLFPQAFVVWYLPRASTTDINGGTTAFGVTVSGGAVASVSATAAPAWAAIALHPYPPTLFDDPASGRSARNAVASFLIYDPARSRAGLSGLTTSLTNPSATSQRIAAAFAMDHHHEFTHALTGLRDEYLDVANLAPTSWSGTSNVVGTSQCSQLPWAHLLNGTAINPNTDQLVGAFGNDTLGYHSELLCLLNGTHDNGQVFYSSAAPTSSCTQSSCTLRSQDRMCNFCRETTALRIFQRSGVLPTTTAGFTSWVSQYRTPFYATYGFKVPAKVPQSNDVNPPDNGATIFQACTP